MELDIIFQERKSSVNQYLWYSQIYLAIDFFGLRIYSIKPQRVEAEIKKPSGILDLFVLALTLSQYYFY